MDERPFSPAAVAALTRLRDDNARSGYSPLNGSAQLSATALAQQTEALLREGEALLNKLSRK